MSLNTRLEHLAEKKRIDCFTENNSIVVLPNADFDEEETKKILKENHSKGVRNVRKLVNYFHAPVDCHPENLDASDPSYAALSKSIYPLLTFTDEEIETILFKITQGKLYNNNKNYGIITLRNKMIPIIIQFFYQIIFNKAIDQQYLLLFEKNAINFKKTIRFISKPNMRLRKKLINHLYQNVCIQKPERMQSSLPENVDNYTLAKLLMGVFFHSGVIQLSEFFSHIIMAISQNEEIQTKVVNNLDNKIFIDAVLHETLRMYPLVGISDRNLDNNYVSDKGSELKSGSNVMFDFLACNSIGVENPNIFDPYRWIEKKGITRGYIPFGAGTRQCPARKLSYSFGRAFIKIYYKNYLFYSPAIHDRALSSGGLVVFTKHSNKMSAFQKKYMLLIISYLDKIYRIFYAFMMLKNTNFIKKTNELD